MDGMPCEGGDWEDAEVSKMTVEEKAEIDALLASALEHDPGTHTVEDVWSMVEAHEAVLIQIGESIAVVQFLQSPLRKEILVWLAAGEMEDMKEIERVVCELGRLEGCAVALFRGRKGWERTFLTRDDGWHATHVTYQKELR